MQEYLINSLSSGELTPRAAGRIDVAAYKNGAKSILNGIVLPQGGVTRKPGSFMLEALVAGGGLLEFQGTDGVGHILVFHNGTIDVFLLGTNIQTIASSLYTTAKIPNIQFAIDGNLIYLVDGSIIPRIITYVPSTGNFTIANISAVAIEGTWDNTVGFSTSGNFPYAVTFYEGRLIFGNTDNFPQHVWGSNVKNYALFTMVGADLVATDGFEIKVNSKRGPKVLWLSGQRGLFVGTSRGVFSISDENSLLSPVSLISAKQNSAYPANTTPGFELGGELFYVQAGERKVRLAVFDRDKDIYNTPDITSAAEHITSGRIKKVVVQMLPETVVWAVLEDGDIITFSYNKENQVAAWTRLETQGEYKDIAITREGNTETVYVIADRDGTEYFEKMNPIDFENKEYMYLDSAITKTFGSELTITNIETVSDRVKVTIAGHGYTTGDFVGVSGTGIVGIDKVIFQVEVDDVNNFFLVDEIMGYDIDVAVTPAITIGSVQEAGKTIDGLSHIAGFDISIMSGPVYISTGTVSSGGEVVAVNRRTTFTVGLNYYTDISPMNIGIAKSQKKNIKHLAVELYKTIAPKGGKDEDSLDYFKYKKNIVMNEPTEMFTGLSEIPFRGGSEYAGEILVRQELPLPMTVLAIIAEMEVY